MPERIVDFAAVVVFFLWYHRRLLLSILLGVVTITLVVYEKPPIEITAYKYRGVGGVGDTISEREYCEILLARAAYPVLFSVTAMADEGCLNLRTSENPWGVAERVCHPTTLSLPQLGFGAQKKGQLSWIITETPPFPEEDAASITWAYWRRTAMDWLMRRLVYSGR